jgi:hypothetical protein
MGPDMPLRSIKLEEMKPRTDIGLSRGTAAERSDRCAPRFGVEPSCFVQPVPGAPRMLRAIGCGVLLAFLIVPTSAAEAPGSAPNPAPNPAPSAVSSEELLGSLAKCTKPDWASKFRPPAAVALNSRVQIALVLGGVFADGYLAAQAEDAQQCRNIGKDLLRLSKILGVHSELLDRSRSIADSAQKKDWAVLRRELQASENELGTALRKHEDEGLARLVSLGTWMRSMEIVASLLTDHYVESGAALLRQPASGLFLGKSLEKLGEKLETDPALDLVRSKLSTVERLLGTREDTPPTQVEVRELAAVLSAILKDVNEKRH